MSFGVLGAREVMHESKYKRSMYLLKITERASLKFRWPLVQGLVGVCRIQGCCHLSTVCVDCTRVPVCLLRVAVVVVGATQ